MCGAGVIWKESNVELITPLIWEQGFHLTNKIYSFRADDASNSQGEICQVLC